jgi:hypothetical protein
MSLDNMPNQPERDSSPLVPKAPRKRYTRPSVQIVTVNSKTDVMGTNCFTSSQTSQQAGNGCNRIPAICFS